MKIINDGIVFSIMQRLKKSSIPVLKMSIQKMECIDYHNKGKIALFAVFDADTWAVKKSMHPFEGCNPDFTIWDSKIHGRAKIAFKLY